MKLGLIGTGRMGKAIVSRLLDKGHQVMVWNRSADKIKELQAEGAVLAATPALLAHESDIVITILTNAEAQTAVFESPDTGIFSLDISGKLFVDMSTVRPESSRVLGLKIASRGAQFVESPVAGTTGPAREGKLFAFVGAEPEAFQAAKPLLSDLCRRVEHIGPVGTASSLKLAVNLPLLVYWQSFGEALSLVAHLNLDPGRLIDILSDTPGATGALKARAQHFVSRLKGNPSLNASFSLLSIRKDLETMKSEAESLCIPVPVVTAAIQAYNESVGSGLGECDSIEQPLYWRAKALK